MPASRAAEVRSPIVAITLVAAVILAAACAVRPRFASEPSPYPGLVTVPQLGRMVEQGEPIGALFAKIQGSGTVYRLTTLQRSNLRASGMPATLLSYMDQGYQRAILKNPELAKSDAQWREIDGYWYGGTPFGWPRDWVVGTPSPGELLR